MKRACLIIFAFLTSALAFAQIEYSPKFFIGGKAGATMSQVAFSPSVKQSMLTAYIAGLTFKYTEENHFGLIGELNIEQRGWKEDFEEHPFRYERTLTYLQIPLLTHIYFGGEKFKGFVNLGPEISYLISENISADFDYNNYQSVAGFPLQNRTNEQLNKDIKYKFDYGISAGLGMEFYIKRRNAISLEARYYFGLGGIFSDRKSDTFSSSRMSSIQLTLGYSFRFK